ncbi:hypothetical protein AYO21_01172 [Fonsecaea monophora]|uniref:RING-type domain-containing protein n=3 Tax=Fonsecaea TaxID=40354 RepID=A0A0D2DR01_9EURO|nr:uncharacterized protein Z517_06881 [Fonsecaea pedrosoi CBS 271.37]XP_022503631.1 hypothetical protein AYO20_02269 [Fonsecaea nubica]XP_022516634.1 hypothetical protein AYO21_01172 [Fonsecaea monophora]KAH0841594.1 hypothetical protein FOPE_07080 [Fonsecaea pedrosoi]KIW80266.1 hypothetical protein Z517_06881 [Fonsecaea pedrosoi CBS 271.37]OAG44682.1 hypothetical protein AYO21_01172 [Fonsecaea monophora]OAL38619.1 hypothetical protein AYO20_02269 [Fonsecaea nubica]
MSSYETEHASDPPNGSQSQSRRPDLSTFLSLLSEVTPDRPEERAREGAVPVPADVSAVFRSLAEAFEVMRRVNDNADSNLLESMIQNLMDTAERPPREVKGVDEEYIAALERVNIKKVKKDADCPICGNAFVEDPHPLLVRLPCHQSHIFDLECIRPWLLVNGTCPLDRVDLAQRERDRKKKHLEEIKKNAAPDDEEEEWDGLYG